MLREHDLVCKGVGLIDLPPFAKIKVSGPKSREFLDFTVAGTVPQKGRTSLAHALTEGGKVMAEWTITGDPHDAESFVIVTGSGVSYQYYSYVQFIPLLIWILIRLKLANRTVGEILT